MNGEVNDGKPISARFGNMAQCSWKELRMVRNTSSIGWTEPVGQAVVKGFWFVNLETRGRAEPWWTAMLAMFALMRSTKVEIQDG